MPETRQEHEEESSADESLESAESSADSSADLGDPESPTIAAESRDMDVAAKRSYEDLEQRNSYLEESMAEIRAKHQAMLTKLTQESEHLRDELLQLRLAYAQKLKDFERAKLRIENEYAKREERDKESVLVPFLGVVDDLERATEAAERSRKDPMVLNGVRLIWGNLLRTLLSFDVRALDALGKVFDASVHEAVATEYVDDPARAGTVVEVVQTGYLIGERLLRPAKVIVGKASASY